ncbi:MAG: citramalate synthase [Clostridiales bacterium]|nr:citramalate synthase [Clostridiales bacterium]
MKIELLDTTLRDGAQGEGISFSIKDKINIIKALDEFGIPLIEAGNPASNPKDETLFLRLSDLPSKTARIVAFGSTRRKDIDVCSDEAVGKLAALESKIIAIFGKCSDTQVEKVLCTTKEENLRMIFETVAYLRQNGKEVIFDAEHFFDGYKSNTEYALQAIRTAENAGAKCIVLCDTNGGSFPDEIYEITKRAAAHVNVKIGMHAHNDTGFADANAFSAVLAGATHVQGTFIGFGERCGNTNLATIIAGLQLKRGYECIPPENIASLTDTARYIAEIINMTIPRNTPYVGDGAFSHKGGMHIDGVNKFPAAYEHIDPALVGNERRFLVSEISGRASVYAKIKKIAPELSKDSEETTAIISKLKKLENEGFQYEGADASFELFIRKELGIERHFFELEQFKIIEEQPAIEDFSVSAIVKIKVDNKSEITAAQGDGPVHALDRALRKALEVFYPTIAKVHLIDYKVRVLDPREASAARVRVLISSTDGDREWTTVGVSDDVILASWMALVDSIEYRLLRDKK